MRKNILKVINFIIIININIITIIFPGVILAAPPGSDQGLGCGGGFGVFGDILCKNNDKETVGSTLNKGISTIIGFLTIVAALFFLFQFIIGGYQWIAAGGDKQQTTEARDKITNSLIGLIIIVIATAIVGIIGKVLGLDILNPGEVLQNLGI